MTSELSWLILGYLALINPITFLLFWVDKSQAQNGGRRIPESRLLMLAIVGGSPAAIMACHLLHHKTRKVRFLAGLYVIAVVQVCLAIIRPV